MNKLTECPICDSLYINIQTNWTHLFYLACIRKLHDKSSKCPMCRQEMTHIYLVLAK